MSTHLESLHGALFTPLDTSAAAEVIGGAAAGTTYTYIGPCLLDEKVVADFAAEGD